MSKGRPRQELLVGNDLLLEHFASLYYRDDQPHTLQKALEFIVEEELDDYEKEIFYLRFGEQLSFRQIARRMGYASHQTFQLKVEKIIQKVKNALEQWIG